MRLLSCVAALLSATTLALPQDTSDKSGLENFESKEAGFTVAFPGKPKVQELPTNDKAVRKHLFFAFERDGVHYVVRCLIHTKEFADKLNNLDPVKFAKQQKELTAKSTQDKVLAQKDLAIGKEKRPGYELLVQDAKSGFGRVRAFYANGRLYNLLVGGPKREAVTDAAADRFLESFRISD